MGGMSDMSDMSHRDGASDLGVRHAINLSTAWLPPDPAAGRADWLRRFGMPTGLESGDRVWLVVESPAGCGVALGEHSLPPVVAGTCRRYDVTAALQSRNDLVIVATVGVAPAVADAAHGRCDLPQTIGRVRLEIESASRGPASG